MERAQLPRPNERFFCKFKESKEARGGVFWYAAQGNAQVNAGIATKRRFRTETRETRRFLSNHGKASTGR